MDLFHVVAKMGLSVEQVDKLTGPVIGRPKSATFRTVDLVGLDTLVHTANGVAENAPNDEMQESFIMPDFVNKMMEKKWLGTKTKQGFYKKEIVDGKKAILSIDLNTLAYKPQQKAKFPTLELTKTIDNVIDRFKVLVKGQDQAGEFYRKTFASLFQYASNRIPEISDELYRLLSKSICDKLIKTSKKFSQVILYPIKNRLVTCLIEISDKNRINNFKTQEIADYLGVTARHVRRILGELYAEKIIEKQVQSIYILNKKSLYKYVIKD